MARVAAKPNPCHFPGPRWKWHWNLVKTVHEATLHTSKYFIYSFEEKIRFFFV